MTQLLEKLPIRKGESWWHLRYLCHFNGLFKVKGQVFSSRALSTKLQSFCSAVSLYINVYFFFCQLTLTFLPSNIARLWRLEREADCSALSSAEA
jgi:hypothetical protein